MLGTGKLELAFPGPGAPARRPPGYLAAQIRTCPAGVYGGILARGGNQ
jgi:hypothetical protein